MSNYENMLRIFREIRLHPWIPEHKLFIDQQIAMLTLDPETKNDGERYKVQYEDKMTKYLLENPVTETFVTEIIEEPKEEVNKAPKSKKRGRPFSSTK